jgi:serine phosphatase RsbU (regulator of sigma subunit)
MGKCCYLNLSVIRLFVIIITVLCSLSTFAQNISHLESELKNAQGISKSQIQLELSQAYLKTDPDKSISYASKALSYGRNNNNDFISSNANSILAQAYFRKDDYSKAYSYAEASQGYFKENDEANYASVKELLGNISFEQKKYERSINHLQKAFEYYSGLNDHRSLGFIASKVGSAHERLKHYQDAVKWHSIAYNNFRKSRNIREMILTQSVLGGVYSNYGDYKSAKSSLQRALDLANDNDLMGDFKYLKKRLETISLNAETNESSTTAYERDESIEQEKRIINQRAKSLEEIEKLSEEKQLAELKIRVQQDEYEKKLLAEQLEKMEVEEALKQEKLEKRNLELELNNERLISEKKTVENQRLFISLGASLLIITLVLMALFIKNRSNRKLGQKNLEIQSQKEEIERKQESINQSIVYATKIQEAILPPHHKLKDCFTDAFVYLNPKDNVSGDFVWVHHVNDKVLLCVADCTGHGVPGAFMSIIFNNILDEIVKKEDIYDPGQVLERASSILFEKVKEQTEEISSFKDGMDATFLTLDLKRNEAYYCGAKNNLIMIRDSVLSEFKGVRRSIDITHVDQDKASFKTESIGIQKNDIFYLSTDGYPDQMGGPNKEKYYRQPFRDLLLDTSAIEMKKQKHLLDQTFKEWKGQNEQIDDVLVVGFRI